MASAQPIGSTLLKRNPVFKKDRKKGKLNLIDAVKMDCLNSDFATTDCSNNSGTSTASSLVVQPDTSATVVSTPFTYADVDTVASAGDCDKLTSMINQTQNTMMTSKFNQATMDEWNKWIAYAQDKYSASCKVVPSDILPVGGTAPIKVVQPIPDTSAPPSVDDGIPPSAVPVPEPPTAAPTVENPDIIQTMSAPSSAPYPTGSGDGSGGGSGSSTPEVPAKKKNWFWLVFAGATATGFILFKPKAK